MSQTRGMVTVADILGRVDLAKVLPPSPVAKPVQTNLPPVTRTPAPVRSKVMANPVRVPIDRRSALFIAPNRDWTTQPPPDAKPDVPKLIRELAETRAQLKEARNELGEMAAKLGNAKEVARSFREQLGAAQKQIASAKEMEQLALAENARLEKRLAMFVQFEKLL